MINITLNKNINPETEYIDRPTVKAVIVNNEGKILVFNSNLVGGGVENNETKEEALYRETLEETGTKIEVIKQLGCVSAYREATKQKYVMYGYFCKYIDTIANPVDEIANPAFWENPKDSIVRFEKDIEILKNSNQNSFKPDEYEAKLYNREMSLAFIKEAFYKNE